MILSNALIYPFNAGGAGHDPLGRPKNCTHNSLQTPAPEHSFAPILDCRQHRGSTIMHPKHTPGFGAAARFCTHFSQLE